MEQGWRVGVTTWYSNHSQSSIVAISPVSPKESFGRWLNNWGGSNSFTVDTSNSSPCKEPSKTLNISVLTRTRRPFYMSARAERGKRILQCINTKKFTGAQTTDEQREASENARSVNAYPRSLEPVPHLRRQDPFQIRTPRHLP